MNETMKYLCENIQGCKLGYTQSDEISLLLIDTDKITTDAWFDYNVQKMTSIAAGMATIHFYKTLQKEIRAYREKYNVGSEPNDFDEGFDWIYYNKLLDALEKDAVFDCRCFSIPENEVVNAFLWRQQDCTRNAIQMLGQCNFSHKELQGKDNDEVQEMLFTQKGINFNNMPTEFKRGVCCVKEVIQNPNVDIKDGYYPRAKWILDKEIPIFSQDREYIEKKFKKTEI